MTYVAPSHDSSFTLHLRNFVVISSRRLRSVTGISFFYDYNSRILRIAGLGFFAYDALYFTYCMHHILYSFSSHLKCWRRDSERYNILVVYWLETVRFCSVRVSVVSSVRRSTEAAAG